MKQSLQQTYAPQNTCFGCGSQNPDGLHVESFVEGDVVVAHWRPKPHHEAFPGILNGGIIGAILDCHSNWTAAWFLMQQQGAKTPPCTVTAEYYIKLHRPTPTDQILFLSAKLVELTDDRATIEATLNIDETVFATCLGIFVAVKPGHPAYHRW